MGAAYCNFGVFFFLFSVSSFFSRQILLSVFVCKFLEKTSHRSVGIENILYQQIRLGLGHSKRHSLRRRVGKVYFDGAISF